MLSFQSSLGNHGISALDPNFTHVVTEALARVTSGGQDTVQRQVWD